jgi:hypothetical protein
MIKKLIIALLIIITILGCGPAMTEKYELRLKRINHVQVAYPQAEIYQIDRSNYLIINNGILYELRVSTEGIISITNLKKVILQSSPLKVFLNRVKGNYGSNVYAGEDIHIGILLTKEGKPYKYKAGLFRSDFYELEKIQ